jgi:hypothetical protein
MDLENMLGHLALLSFLSILLQILVRLSINSLMLHIVVILFYHFC